MVRTFSHGGFDSFPNMLFRTMQKSRVLLAKYCLFLNVRFFLIEFFGQFLALLFFRQRLRSTKKPCNYLKTQSSGRKRGIKRRETNRGQLRRKRKRNSTRDGVKALRENYFWPHNLFPDTLPLHAYNPNNVLRTLLILKLLVFKSGPPRDEPFYSEKAPKKKELLAFPIGC